MLIFKISIKHVTGGKIIKIIKDKFLLNEYGNLSEYDNDLCQLELVSAMEDHFPNHPKTSFDDTFPSYRILLPKSLRNKALHELFEYNMFRYLGNSRIDGYPLFTIDLAAKRDLILEQLLGI